MVCLVIRWFVLLHSKLLHEVHELQLSTVGSHQVAHIKAIIRLRMESKDHFGRRIFCRKGGVWLGRRDSQGSNGGRRRGNWVRLAKAEPGENEEAKERKQFQYHQRPRGSLGCGRVHTDTILYRSCVRLVTGNGFTSVKGDIKKMKNTPALLATCAGYNYVACRSLAFCRPLLLLLKFRRSREGGGDDSLISATSKFQPLE
nr:PREDICTED: uncharacterized protein LOC105664362 isoform X1 [Megachile rotundata]XP_012154277.1 PREDICTED: uncharacterized protein LOC105664362 isoform X1 [Megachile rotundata]